MKRLRRIAALSFLLLLGFLAWFVVMLCRPTMGELRLSRELSSGRLVAHVPPPNPLLFGLLVFGEANLQGTYSKPPTGETGLLPIGSIFPARTRPGQPARWYLQLDPRDKSWEIQVTERHPVFLKLGTRSWRIGTRTRIWHTRRTAL